MNTRFGQRKRKFSRTRTRSRPHKKDSRRRRKSGKLYRYELKNRRKINNVTLDWED